MASSSRWRASLRPTDIGKPSVNQTDISYADQESVSYADPVQSAMPFDVSYDPIKVGKAMRAIRTRFGIRAWALACAVIGLGVAIVCVFIALIICQI